MLNHSAAYAEAIVASVRRQFVRALFDLYDPDMVMGTVTASSSDAQLSRTATAADRGPDSSQRAYASLEWNRWVLDGTVKVPPDDPADQEGQIGWVGGVLSGADGAFSSPPWLEIAFTGVDTLQAVTIMFSDLALNGVATEFVLDVYSGANLMHTETITDNTEALVVVDGFTVSSPTRIRLTINAWSEGYRRPRVPRLMPGLYEVWTGQTIESLDVYSEVTFSGLSLPYSTCGITVDNSDHRFDPYSPNTIFESIEERQAIGIEMGLELADGTVEWLPGGTYYQQTGGWETSGGLTITFKLLDVCGMLSRRKFEVPGTLPTTLEGWIAAIMASLGTAFASRYIVDSDVASEALTVADADAVSGKTCGEVLRFACMATNTWPRQDVATGYLRVGKLSQTNGNRITEGNMSNWPAMAANDDVSDITITLSDGTALTFAGNNTQSENSLAVANPFIHDLAGAQKALISCLFQFGGRTFSVHHRGNPSSECGDIQSIDTRFGTTLTGRLAKQQLKFDRNVMLNVPSQLVQSPNDTLYTNREVLTGSGTWTAPATTTYHVIIIGGGTGGTGGGGGVMKKSGDLSIFDPSDTTGSTGGTGGKVNTVTVSGTSGHVYSYSCGSGGAGGAGGERDEDGHTGTDGGDSTFGTYSSAAGTRYASGVMSISSGDVYAQAGPDYGNTITGTYGSGGVGGKPGRNGLRSYNEDGDPEILRPRAGEAGGAGQAGCIIIEWSE